MTSRGADQLMCSFLLVSTPSLAEGKLPRSRFTSQYSRGQWCPHLKPHLGQCGGGQVLLGMFRAQEPWIESLCLSFSPVLVSPSPNLNVYEHTQA